MNIAEKTARLAMLAPADADLESMRAFALPLTRAACLAQRGPCVPQAAALREDVPQPGLPLCDVLQNAAQTDGPYLTVPRTVE